MNLGENDEDVRTILSLLEGAKQDAAFMDRLANTLDEWAVQSRSGGWSTHQVDANAKEANECRRRAAQIRAAIAKATAP